MDYTWKNMYDSVKGHIHHGNIEEAERVTLEAHTLFPERSEAIYALTRYFRERSIHDKAWKYYQLGHTIPLPKDTQDVEHDVYEHLFLYEKTILNYYVGTPKEESLIDFITYFNMDKSTLYDNLQFYAYPYTLLEERKLDFPDIDDFTATSTSILRHGTNYILNIRYVNYRIQPDSSYLMVENGDKKPYYHLRTRNMKVIVSEDFVPIGPYEEMIINKPALHDTNIHGLEDIRLYYEDSMICFISASSDYSHNGGIQQVMGVYDIENNSLKDLVHLHSPKNHWVEKNWIPTGNSTFIYSWSPFVVGFIKETKFKQIIRYSTPPFFKHIRGSTPLIEYKGYYYCMVHCMIDSRPRKYYHMLVRIIPDTFRIDSYTLPLYFKNNYIEYTIGIEIRDEILYSIVSQNDCNPILVKIHMSTLKWIPNQYH